MSEPHTHSPFPLQHYSVCSDIPRQQAGGWGGRHLHPVSACTEHRPNDHCCACGHRPEHALRAPRPHVPLSVSISYTHVFPEATIYRTWGKFPGCGQDSAQENPSLNSAVFSPVTISTRRRELPGSGVRANGWSGRCRATSVAPP